MPRPLVMLAVLFALVIAAGGALLFWRDGANRLAGAEIVPAGPIAGETETGAGRDADGSQVAAGNDTQPGQPGGATDTTAMADNSGERPAAESQAVAEADEAAPGEGNPAGQTAPSFDVVRVEPSGEALFAGRAPPGGDVEIRSGAEVLARTTADADGAFVAIPDEALPPGEHDITARIAGNDTPAAESQVSVTVPAPGGGPAVIVTPEPEQQVASAETLPPRPGQDDPQAPAGDATPPGGAASPDAGGPAGAPDVRADTAARDASPGGADGTTGGAGADRENGTVATAEGGGEPTDRALDGSASPGAAGEHDDAGSNVVNAEPGVGGAPSAGPAAESAPGSEEDLVAGPANSPPGPGGSDSRADAAGESDAPDAGASGLPERRETTSGDGGAQSAAAEPAVGPENESPSGSGRSAGAAPADGSDLSETASGKPAAEETGEPGLPKGEPKAEQAVAAAEQNGGDAASQTGASMDPEADSAQPSLSAPAEGDAPDPNAGAETAAAQPDGGDSAGTSKAAEAKASEGTRTAEPTLSEARGELPALNYPGAAPAFSAAGATADDGALPSQAEGTVPERSIDLEGEASVDLAATAPPRSIEAEAKPNPQPEPEIGDADSTETAAPSESAGTADTAVDLTPPLSIKAAEAEANTLYVAGEAKPGTMVRVYAGDEPVGQAVANSDGAWLVEASRRIPAGRLMLRAEADARDSAEPRARVELPFVRHADGIVLEPLAVAAEAGGTASAEARLPPPTFVMIRRGDNLWRISRRSYGRGIRFKSIYAANSDRIKNPHRIFPGQVFVLPKRDPSWDEAAN